jgi:hypothetical protein
MLSNGLPTDFNLPILLSYFDISVNTSGYTFVFAVYNSIKLVLNLVAYTNLTSSNVLIILLTSPLFYSYVLT